MEFIRDNYLTQKEVWKLFDKIGEEDILEIRDKAIIEVLYSSGLRANEACNLRMQDIDFENMFMVIINKRKRERLVPLGEEACRILTKYLGSSRNLILQGRKSNSFFVLKNGNSLKTQNVCRVFRKHFDKAKIKKRATPHTLRRSFVQHLLKNGADLKSLNELLGPNSILRRRSKK